MMNAKTNCIGCHRTLLKQTEKVSIFEIDSEVRKCLVFKIYQITRNEGLMQDTTRAFVCQDCRDLLIQIYSLEDTFKELYYQKTEEENACENEQKLEAFNGIQESDSQKEESLISTTSFKDGEKILTCKLCGKIYPIERRFNLNRHLKNQHSVINSQKTPHQIKLKQIDVKGKKFICQICQEAFTRKSNLNCHKKIAHSIQENSKYRRVDEKQYPCQLCDVKFGRQMHLNRHLKSKHKMYGNKYHLDSEEREYSNEMFEDSFVGDVTPVDVSEVDPTTFLNKSLTSLDESQEIVT